LDGGEGQLSHGPKKTEKFWGKKGIYHFLVRKKTIKNSGKKKSARQRLNSKGSGKTPRSNHKKEVTPFLLLQGGKNKRTRAKGRKAAP